MMQNQMGNQLPQPMANGFKCRCGNILRNSDINNHIHACQIMKQNFEQLFLIFDKHLGVCQSPDDFNNMSEILKAF